MHIFDYSFLQNSNLPASFINVTADIYSLRTLSSERTNSYEEIFSELEQIAKIQSVKSSNEIEGIVSTDERIAEIVNGNTAPRDHNEMEIAGYRDALAKVHKAYASLPFSEETILDLHKTMLDIAGYAYAGEYKTRNNAIIELEQSSGRRTVRFRPVPADETKDAMEQMVLAYQEASADSSINQLLLIPCVILDFLCIHPFRDGNGRISRLLSLLLLYQNDFDAGKYISFEEQINERKGNYYKALSESSEGWHDNKNDYAPFMMEFLLELYHCYKELDKRFAVIGSKKVTKQARIEATVLNSLTPISKSDILKILPDVSASTAEMVLGEMVRDGQILKVGAGRATKYIKNR